MDDFGLKNRKILKSRQVTAIERRGNYSAQPIFQANCAATYLQKVRVKQKGEL